MKHARYLTIATIAMSSLAFTGCSGTTGTNLGRAVDGTTYGATYGTNYGSEGTTYGGTNGSMYYNNGMWYNADGTMYYTNGTWYYLDGTVYNGTNTDYDRYYSNMWNTGVGDYYSNTANGYNYNMGTTSTVTGNGGLTGTLYGDDSGYSTYSTNR